MSLQYGLYPLPGQSIPDDHCNAPSNLQAVATGDIVTFSWDKPHDVLYYVLTITEQGVGAPPPIVQNVAGLRFTIQLNPNKTYAWSVKSVCDAVRSSGVTNGANVITGNHVVQCLPVNLSQVIVTGTEAALLLSWPANSDALAYKVYYRAQGTLLGYSVLAIQTNQASINGVIPNTIYEYYILTVCKDGKTATSDTGTFQTPLDPADCPPPVIRAVVNQQSAVVVWDYTGLHNSYDIFINGLLYLADYPANILNLSNLDPATTYSIAVVGRCADGISIAGSYSFTTAAAPCNTPANVAHIIAEDTATISWDAVAGAQGYEVVVNGTLYETTELTQQFLVEPGTQYTVQVRTVCTSGKSNYASLGFTTAFSCYVYVAEDIMVNRTILGGIKITYSWPVKAGIDHYRYRRRIITPLGTMGDWGEWITTTGTHAVYKFLQALFYADFELEATCVNGEVHSVTILAGVTPTEAGQKPVITSFDSITHNSFCVNFTLPDGRLTGTFVAKVTTGGVTKEYPGTTTRICIPDALPATLYSVVIEDREPGFSIIPSDADTLTTCPLPQAPATLTAVFDTDGNIQVDWSAVSGADSYTISSIPAGTTDLTQAVEHGSVTSTDPLTYTILGYVNQLRTVLVRVNFSNGCAGYTAQMNITCPKVTGLKAEVSGTMVTLSWNAIANVQGYKVKLISLTAGVEEYFTTNAYLNVEGLTASSDYGYTVEAQCSEGVVGAVSDQTTFRTLYENGSISTCPEPSFTAIMQSSDLADPDASGTTVDNSAAATINYTTYQGDTFDRSMTFKDAANNPINITGYDFKFRIYNSIGLLTKTLSVGGGLTVGGASGVLSIYMTAVETSALALGTYTYKLHWTTPTGVIKLIAQGTFVVTEP